MQLAMPHGIALCINGYRGVTKGCNSRLNFQQHPGRVLDGLLDSAQEHDGFTSVHNAMIIREGEIHHRADDHLALEGDGPVLNGVQSQNT